MENKKRFLCGLHSEGAELVAFFFEKLKRFHMDADEFVMDWGGDEID